MKIGNTNAKKHGLTPSFVRKEDRKTFARWYRAVRKDPADVAARVTAERLTALDRFNRSDAADDEANRGAADKAVTGALNALRTRLDIMADEKGQPTSAPTIVLSDLSRIVQVPTSNGWHRAFQHPDDAEVYLLEDKSTGAWTPHRASRVDGREEFAPVHLLPEAQSDR